MQRMTIIKRMNADQAGHYLCDLMDSLDAENGNGCDVCPVKAMCEHGEGWKKFLKTKAAEWEESLHG